MHGQILFSHCFNLRDAPDTKSSLLVILLLTLWQSSLTSEEPLTRYTWDQSDHWDCRVTLFMRLSHEAILKMA